MQPEGVDDAEAMIAKGETMIMIMTVTVRVNAQLTNKTSSGALI